MSIDRREDTRVVFHEFDALSRIKQMQQIAVSKTSASELNPCSYVLGVCVVLESYLSYMGATSSGDWILCKSRYSGGYSGADSGGGGRRSYGGGGDGGGGGCCGGG